MKMENYARLSLETHLFFARIMKEHGLFLEAGFVCVDTDWIEKAGWFMQQFENLLRDTVRISNGRVGRMILSSGELVTAFTIPAERHTQQLSGVPIDSRITRREQELRFGRQMRADREVMRAVAGLNLRAKELLDGFIDFKESILAAVKRAKIFTFNYPLLIEHILREAKLYRATIEELMNQRELSYMDLKKTEEFWNQIMMEHALFIRGLLDPTEDKLIRTADQFAEEYKELLEQARKQDCRALGMTEEALEETMRFSQFKAAGTQMYVLKKDAEKVKEEARKHFEMTPPQPAKEVQPLVLRANVGDEVKICFTHSLHRPLSIHVQGLSYDVQTSDGASVGFNRDTTTMNQIVYTWYADREGVFSFQDMGDTRSGEEGTNVHGLFGAIIVEAAQSVWLDPETGEELESGLFADIYHPVRPAFREYAVFFHDELEIKDKDGNQPIDPHTGLPSATTAISYRSEPMRNRHPLTDEHSDTGEDISMSSWVYGDPAPPILRAYAGDPSKIRLIHGGVKETHVFHLHNHQWRLEGDNPNSTIVDSVSIRLSRLYQWRVWRTTAAAASWSAGVRWQ